MKNHAAPKILNEIVEYLNKSNIDFAFDDDEGRVNSKKDENSVIKLLEKKFGKKVRPVGLRQFGDMIVTDEKGNDHYVNIKTTKGNSADNAFSKLGFLWAFTDLEVDDLPVRITNKTWFKLITKHKKNTDRDYWFLSLIKDGSGVCLRGVKQIQNWAKNGTNNLQIYWQKEHDSKLKTYSFEEAWQRVIIDGVLYCWEKHCEGMREGISYRKNGKKNG